MGGEKREKIFFFNTNCWKSFFKKKGWIFIARTAREWSTVCSSGGGGVYIFYDRKKMYEKDARLFCLFRKMIFEGILFPRCNFRFSILYCVLALEVLYLFEIIPSSRFPRVKSILHGVEWEEQTQGTLGSFIIWKCKRSVQVRADEFVTSFHFIIIIFFFLWFNRFSFN